jgi:hypothetical protein
MAATYELAPPGRARITSCPDCGGMAGRDCGECEGTGRLVWRACPRCGGTSSWDFVNGRDESRGMACRSPRCGYHWQADDPDWVIQRLPG